MRFTKNYYWLYIVILIILLDRYTKILVLDHLYLAQPLKLLPMLNLSFSANSGAAFGFLSGASGWQNWLFMVIGGIVAIYLIRWELKLPPPNHWLKVALALILGGGLGNLYDRVVYHQVIDFIDFYYKTWHYPTFNLADAAISSGAIMLIIDLLFLTKKIRSAQ